MSKSMLTRLIKKCRVINKQSLKSYACTDERYIRKMTKREDD